LSAADLASRVAPKTPTLASLFLCSRVIGLKPLSSDQPKVYDKLSFLPSFFDELLTGGGARHRGERMGLVDDCLLFELISHRLKGDTTYACSRQAVTRRT
jgi:hypothetical protein